MTETDIRWMNYTIELAARCAPIDPDRIPKVAAVICVGGEMIAAGTRGSGRSDDDNHAELNALNNVADKRVLREATVYSTLEPCTPLVRCPSGKI